MLEYIVEILKEQRKKREAEEATCPIIDIYGLGPVRDPDAYEIGGEPKYKEVA